MQISFLGNNGLGVGTAIVLFSMFSLLFSSFYFMQLEDYKKWNREFQMQNYISAEENKSEIAGVTDETESFSSIYWNN